ncbi:MAG: FMN-binding protein [Planctomycetota bacterium]
MKSSSYTLGYAGILGAVCALLLTAAARFTEPYQDANADAERKRNILDVLQVSYQPKISSKGLLKVFEENVDSDETGQLKLYKYPKGSAKVETVAVAFEGPGLWGPIKGLLALGPDMRTIRGITFYKQEETPGLGGEIASAWFREQFKGKKITDDSGNAGILIKGGRDKSAVNEVDAITGATMTCEKVQELLNSVIKRIVEENNDNGQ